MFVPRIGPCNTDGWVETNHTAAAAFTNETPLINAIAVEEILVSIPFPSLPALNKTALDLAFREFQYKLAKQWTAYGGHIYGQEELSGVLVNVSYKGLKVSSTNCMNLQRRFLICVRGKGRSQMITKELMFGKDNGPGLPKLALVVSTPLLNLITFCASVFVDEDEASLYSSWGTKLNSWTKHYEPSRWSLCAFFE